MTTLIIILISVVAVGVFALGLSLTLIFKGHHIKSEISDNENMRNLGIKCAAQQMREEECGMRGNARDGASGGQPGNHADCAPGGCASCASDAHVTGASGASDDKK